MQILIGCSIGLCAWFLVRYLIVGLYAVDQNGSIYIRKVHLRDSEMIKQIESEVVNRLRQVTSAITQDGANQVSIIASTAERQAAVEFAKAAAIRPAVVGEALRRISEDPAVAAALFDILEAQKIIDGEARITLLPKQNGLLPQMLFVPAESHAVHELTEAAAKFSVFPLARVTEVIEPCR